MKKALKFFLLTCCAIFLACQIGPQPIEYGVDGCHFCKMTIVDKLHAAEIVTDKGKVYKFDAIECMVNFMKDFDTTQIEHYLSNNYLEPETLIDATRSSFLITENIPSPMGAFLSAFNSIEDALSVQKEKGGSVFNWKELLDHLNY